MKNFDMRFLNRDEMDGMVPFIELLNPDMERPLIKNRLEEMKRLPVYNCLGVFDGAKLIAVCGMWEVTKFYSGKQLEIDNFMIYPDYRSKGLGKAIMNWIYAYGRSRGCLSVELNSYVGASKAHKFYFREGFHIKGYHMERGI